MLYKKEGFPEEDELVLCKVTNVHHHSVFVNLDEYDKTGMIHISEVSPGRIRNIRDYVKEGKVVVCKVLKIHEERGHIDLSLRRVNEGQKRKKGDEIKQEQKAEKIVEFVAQKLKKETKEVYDEITEIVFKKYPSLASCFEEVVANDKLLKELGVPDKISKPLTEIIKQRIKPLEVVISGRFALTSYEPDGISIIKNALKNTESVDKEKLSISYLGGGKYKITVKSDDYKTAEKKLDEAIKITTEFMENKKGICEFARDEK